MTDGLDGILSNLTRLQVKAPKVARKAVTEVAEEFEKRLKANTPRSGRGILPLADDTKISGFKGGTQGIFSKDIGYGTEDGWRSHFPDSGTIYQKAQDFKEKTINEMTPVAREIFAEKIKEGLNL